MPTLLYSHPSFLAHDTGAGHPENADRLRAIESSLDAAEFSDLIRKKAPRASEHQIRLIHPQNMLERILGLIPEQGHAHIDADTVVSPNSGEAALRAVGAVCSAVDAVIGSDTTNAFCAVRPPGHHAEPNRSMGFCLFNNIAIGAEYARSRHQIKSVAIVDFDVHHGNGTQSTFYDQPDVLYASTHQYPLYPGTGSADEIGVGNIFNAPLKSGSSTKHFQSAMKEKIFPALHEFQPELLLISAGFDAHRDDPLASLNFVEDDYAWVTQELLMIAEQYCQNRVISVLEGGYHFEALGRSVAAHVLEMLSATR